MRILHITSWFPHRANPKEGVWIKNHIEALGHHVDLHDVIHLSVSRSKYKVHVYTDSVRHIIIRLPLWWSVLEIISGFVLFLLLAKKRFGKHYDLINFHIAYPNLVYWHLIKGFVKRPIIITEHWSAYHYNFQLNIPPPRIARIFRQNIPLITVSKALLEDIKVFSAAQFPAAQIPNVVDKKIFYDQKLARSKNFLMVSQWKEPKQPLQVIKAFKQLSLPSSELRIIGFGQQLESMKLLAEGNSNIVFLGMREAKEIAEEMNKAFCFIHPSEYETFSVVCAEALSCGCPVVASKVGGIKEFVNANNGVLVDSNSVEAFREAMMHIYNRPIGIKNPPDFSVERIGKLYFDFLNKQIGNQAEK